MHHAGSGALCQSATKAASCQHSDGLSSDLLAGCLAQHPTMCRSCLQSTRVSGTLNPASARRTTIHVTMALRPLLRARTMIAHSWLSRWVDAVCCLLSFRMLCARLKSNPVMREACRVLCPGHMALRLLLQRLQECRMWAMRQRHVA